MSTAILNIKLYELEQGYGRMQSRLRLCQEAQEEKLLSELETLTNEYAQINYLLEQSAASSRSPAVAELSREQVDFFKKAEKTGGRLPEYLHCPTEDDAEAYALYAEYAIDFAVQSMRYALISAMKAIEAQTLLDKKKEEQQ